MSEEKGNDNSSLSRLLRRHRNLLKRSLVYVDTHMPRHDSNCDQCYLADYISGTVNSLTDSIDRLEDDESDNLLSVITTVEIITAYWELTYGDNNCYHVEHVDGRDASVLDT